MTTHTQPHILELFFFPLFVTFGDMSCVLEYFGNVEYLYYFPCCNRSEKGGTTVGAEVERRYLDKP